jgi:hypothetical protein
MRFAYRRFHNYDTLVSFANANLQWDLHSWQDMGESKTGHTLHDIRAIFTSIGDSVTALPLANAVADLVTLHIQDKRK